jgi:hypothetical protein
MFLSKSINSIKMKLFKNRIKLQNAQNNLSKAIIQQINDSFWTPAYQKHNVARLQHLESLGLAINNKTVIEFGAGVGDHTLFYLWKNCQVIPTEARQDLVDFIQHRFGIDALQLDIENDLAKIKLLQTVDIIHCYGFLYHISNPNEFLEAIVDTSQLLLLESCVSDDYQLEGVYLTNEVKENLTQATSGTGCRPTRSWIFNKLKQLYPYVYMPTTQPKHQEFPINWVDLKSPDHLIRAVFIASKNRLKSPYLIEEIPLIYEPW